jgi:endoglucanase
MHRHRPAVNVPHIRSWSTLGKIVVAIAVTVVAAVVFYEASRPNLGGATEPVSTLPATPGARSAIAGNLYVDPGSQPAAWVQAHPDDRRSEAIRSRIASRPTARWFGEWSGDIGAAVSTYTSAAEEAGKIPVLVPYNIPGRDCNNHSAGGMTDRQAYQGWIDDLATGLDDRRALVVLEPDALPMLDDCLDASGQKQRLRMLSYAVDRLQTKNVWVYLDAGHSNWAPADEMAARLRAANIHDAHGFALNTSNYNSTEQEIAYANELNSLLGTSKPFVIDTSRNGSGSDGDWCNPGGSSIGVPPQTDDSAELLLWLKVPGESDGDCGIAEGTEAGQFSPRLAMRLIKGT